MISGVVTPKDCLFCLIWLLQSFLRWFYIIFQYPRDTTMTLFFFCTTIRPSIRVLIDLFLLFAHNRLTKKYGPVSFIIFFLHDHLPKKSVHRLFITLICTRPFDQSIWSSFICSFFCALPFDQKLGSTLIYFFYLHTAIQPKLGVILTFQIIFLTMARLRTLHSWQYCRYIVIFLYWQYCPYIPCAIFMAE